MPKFLILRLILPLFLCTCVPARLFAQDDIPAHTGIRLFLNDDSTAYFRPILINQFWTKLTRNNPGTAAIDGDGPQERSFGFGIRRARLLFLTELGPRVQLFTQIGINNQTFATGGGSGTGGVGGYGQAKKPQLFVHDAWAQYRLAHGGEREGGFHNSLYLGIGLHFWHGISRLSQVGIPSHMLLDFPIFNFPDIEQGNQFARQFGIYAKGGFGRFHYRFSLNQPFVTDERILLAIWENDRAVLYPTDALATTGYVEYRLLGYEATTLPFRPFTYIGKKRLLNVGLGWYHHPGATAAMRGNEPLQRYDKLVLSADVYAELPLTGTDNSAVTAYFVYYARDYGPNFYRSFGLLNLAPNGAYAAFTGTPTIDGYGNRQPLTGTGDIQYLQLGYLLPRMGWESRLQVFGALSRRDLDRIGEAVYNYDVGANLFVKGHAFKVTLQHTLRPLVFPDGPDGHAGETILQVQMAL